MPGLPAPLPAPQPGLQPRLAVLHRCSYTVTIRQLVGSILRIANSESLFAENCVLWSANTRRIANSDSLFANFLIKLKVLLLDGVDTIKYSTFNTDAFRVTKVFNTLNCSKYLSLTKTQQCSMYLREPIERLLNVFILVHSIVMIQPVLVKPRGAKYRISE